MRIDIILLLLLNFVDVGGGVTACRGFHSSFRTTQGGLLLNMDVSSTMILTPGPVLDFLLTNQNLRDPRQIDWGRAIKNYRYDDDAMVKACGISVEKQLTAVEGRVLNAPKLFTVEDLKVSNSEDCIPRNGRWNFNQKRLFSPIEIKRWAVVNFSVRCDTSHLSRDLINCGRSKGIKIERPHSLIEEDPRWRRSGPVVRVEKVFQLIKEKLPGLPQFLLCVLPERKNCDVYGPWKKKNLSEMGIFTGCISPMKINDQYLTNVLLKINSKLGGVNSLLDVEHIPTLPLLKSSPTLILGMDVSHGSPGQSDIPSIADVVGSRSWPLISRYRASVRTQSPKVEMIEGPFVFASYKRT
ncbi:hypothetical protein IFM89_001557 [Coptis chinensis]|uniref:Piwi domain-containing protein n=1 Tax=Coptis chinensis TaxID=261450 RepID=A0A835HAC7_9MAGN|nr:hypothetical protein IFM89_001557 [Coptis chinensis]